MTTKMMDAEVIRVFNEKGEKIKDQKHWLENAQNIAYFHFEDGFCEARDQANMYIDNFIETENLPEGWEIKVCTEQVEVNKERYQGYCL